MTTKNQPTSMTNNNLRFPAEWEQQDAIMIVWPHANTDWAPIYDEVIDCYRRIVDAITQQGEHIIIVADPCCHDLPSQGELLHIVTCPTNDTWARDTCALTTTDGEKFYVNDFKFNGWGLKFPAFYDNLITNELCQQGLFKGKYVNHLNFAFEGGSIESDGNGLALTTSECLLSKNRNGGFTKAEIDNYLKESFNLKKLLWLDHGYLRGDDTDSHIDTLARLAPSNTILFVGTDNKEDEHYQALLAMRNQLEQFTNLDGEKFRLLELPLPAPIFDEDGNRLPATYANFLIGNNCVFVPTYAQDDNDKKALDIIATAFPNRSVIGIDCRCLIKQHGSLHCVTMQFPKNSLYI